MLASPQIQNVQFFIFYEFANIRRQLHMFEKESPEGSPEADIFRRNSTEFWRNCGKSKIIA